MEHESEVNAFIRQTHELLEREKKRFGEKFKFHPGITLFESSTSFILGKLNQRHTADVICRALLDDKILIRNCSNFTGLSNRFFRVSLKNRDKNIVLIDKLLTLSRSL
jgi:threonine-phosphate decarboxylase